MPDFAIVDTHLHLWDPAHFRISWLDGNDVLNARFLAEEFAQHSRDVHVEAAVYLEVAVEPQYAILEAQYINTLARQLPKIKGIVAAAPVEFGEQARAYYAALAAIGPRLKGVRRLFQGESDAQFAIRPNVIRGIEILADFGFSFDICIFHHQLPAAVELVRRVPQVQFIVDHVAKPDIKGGAISPWREQMREMATLPNVVCKISGMTTEADHAAWTPADLKPYLMHVLDVFGEDRVMFGGDWPVSLQSTTYAEWVHTVDTLTNHLSDKAKKKLWNSNARRIYRLGV
ncbi:MAG: amidohydrolase family protein [Roseiflexaceae bacterium]